ncbi:glycoside hydrolase family protein [Hydrogenimonas urashimensis]|uniref:glycoside hydrolase family protein n=1 Tax=Hydrogenimonas urashimensis TaxID=2740515 RepID=UPI0019158E11|nr:glycoside hydrolase family protein [Hydrogenimonas urashimensis]
MRLIDQIKRHEGFRGMAYQDIYGNWTIGYGTKLPITEEEGELLLRHRLDNMADELRRAYPDFDDLPSEIQSVLLDMLYNLGINRLMTFNHMWEAIQRRDWAKMALEMQNSLWYRQVGSRAEELVAVVDECAKIVPNDTKKDALV